jgi:hypothetical protein
VHIRLKISIKVCKFCLHAHAAKPAHRSKLLKAHACQPPTGAAVALGREAAMLF